LSVKSRGNLPSPLRTVRVTTPDFILCIERGLDREMHSNHIIFYKCTIIFCWLMYNIIGDKNNLYQLNIRSSLIFSITV
jgi:hypothetical protein